MQELKEELRLYQERYRKAISEKTKRDLEKHIKKIKKEITRLQYLENQYRGL